jgi:hypothetical protein
MLQKFVAKHFGKRPLGRLKRRLQDDVKVAFGATGFDCASGWNCFRIVSRDDVRIPILLMLIFYLFLYDDLVVSRQNPLWSHFMTSPGFW